MRNTFINTLHNAAKYDSRIQLLVGDLGFSVIERYQQELPLQFHNVGVAEQNMIGIAAGMAHQGLKPYCYSIANFPLLRPAEFIRNLIDYHCLDVSIISVGGGLAYGNLGYTHHAVQDFAFVSSLLNFEICAPADPSQIKYIFDFILNNKNPKYIRLNRNGEQSLHLEYFDFNGLKIFTNTRSIFNSRSLILTTGAAGQFVELYLNKSSKLRKKFPSTHANIPVWGRSISKNLKVFLENFDEIVVFEDHVVHGGFADWVRNISGKDVIKHSIVDPFIGKVGTQDFFFEAYLKYLEK